MITCTMITCSIILASCGNDSAPKMAKTTNNDQTAMSADASTEKSYPVSLVNNKKDPTCGMPVTAGIGDTLHYKQYVMGFCSEECKAEAKQNLLKNAKAVLEVAVVSLPPAVKTN